jgi:hypothetical protein
MKKHSNYNKSLLFTFLFLLSVQMLSGGEIMQSRNSEGTGLSLATFDIDVTPPLGYTLAYKSVDNTWDLGLRAKGIVLLGAGSPIVVVAFDWITIGNECQDEFKRSLSVAAGTSPDRVAVHTLHQHDTPKCDLQSSFVQSVIQRLGNAVRNSLKNAQPITHIGLGEAQVFKVASNRRILGSDGKVRADRLSSCQDPAIRAEPEGVIDPMVTEVSFWNNEKPVAVLSFYATHPQSYYRTGITNPDFPGIARFFRQLAVPDALHIHFDGAGGNVAAGKYNDGSHEMRGILAERLADGMKRAWETSKREPITSKDIAWTIEQVALPTDPAKSSNSEYEQRLKAGKKIDLECLTLGRARILFMPGGLFVEYQLAAKKMRPDLFVTMAADGDSGPGYIPTAVAFKQGGYEVESSKLLPEVEEIMMTAMRNILKVKP